MTPESDTAFGHGLVDRCYQLIPSAEKIFVGHAEEEIARTLVGILKPLKATSDCQNLNAQRRIVFKGTRT